MSARRLSVLAILICAALGLVACSQRTPAASDGGAQSSGASVLGTSVAQAVEDMRLCGLHPLGSPQIGSAEVSARDAYADSCFESSKAVGPEPIPYLVRKVARLTFVLRERSEANATTTANFHVADGKITESWLELGGANGGRTSLNDHSRLMPPGVYEPSRIRLDEVLHISFADGHKVVRDPKIISHVVSLISDSRPVMADDAGAPDVASYDLLLTHSNGAVTDIRFECPVRGGQTLARVVHPECLHGIRLRPAPGLVEYLDEHLR